MITVRLMGGLGNQMFEYAALRAMMLEYNKKGCISLSGITNKTHNVYSLNYFDIDNNVLIKKRNTFKGFISYLIYGYYCVFIINKKNAYERMYKLYKKISRKGIYCIPDGYMEINPSKRKNWVMTGYFQSAKFFDKYKDVIRKEFTVKEPVMEKNKKLLDDIKSSNSVCVHIRRGDYIGTKHEVCNDYYYEKAFEEMNKKVPNATYYIFSNDIEYVKNNMDFSKYNVVYVEGNNPNYEELRLMYSCKHFIISNSSFSWWAQYLTSNKDRITVAPSKWFQTDSQKSDIFQDDWILIDIK